jgi:hypothetical protein
MYTQLRRLYINVHNLTESLGRNIGTYVPARLKLSYKTLHIRFSIHTSYTTQYTSSFRQRELKNYVKFSSVRESGGADLRN